MAKTTLRRELLGAFALIFAGALVVAVTGVTLLLPTFETPFRAVIYITVLLAVDITVFAVFGRWLIQTRILGPLDRIVTGAQAIAEGDYGRQLPPGDSREVDRLSASLNRMADRLIEHQRELQQNIESLEQTNRDLTEARDELIRAEKMASLGQMAAGVAHEIGNPLAAIIGNVDLLKRRTHDEPLELVVATAEQAKRIDRIVRGLVDYARAREPNVQPINVNDVVEKGVALIATQGRFGDIDILVHLDREIPAVEADPYQLEQVLVNLLLNAADAVEASKEKRIRITTSATSAEVAGHTPARRRGDPPGIDYSHRRRFNRPEPVPRAQPFERGQRLVEINVSDSGHGIPDEQLHRIFEPFMTTKDPGKGTGLGLAVSARLLDGMAGTIRASNTDTGAQFTILLPATEEPAEALTQ